MGANFRAFARARSKNEAYSKLCIVVEEIDEVLYWLELLEELGDEFIEVADFYSEAEEILKITSSIKSKLKVEIQNTKL
ncbi:MAG: four helix bundle protein [Saprospiraceae bacterium]|nr:four helix bundle protein [Saprospiraceae bacterium]